MQICLLFSSSKVDDGCSKSGFGIILWPVGKLQCT